MAFPWAAKKEQEGESGQTADGQSSELQPSEFQSLAGQLDGLGQLLTQANEQITSYLVYRDSLAQASGGDNKLAEKIDSLSEKLGRLTEGTAAPSAEQTPAATDQKSLGPLAEKIDRIEAAVNRLAESGPSTQLTQPGSADRPEAGPPLAEVVDAFNQSVRQLHEQANSQFRQLVDLLSPAEEAEEEAGLGGGAQWEELLLGPDLAANPALAFQRQQLLGGVLEGEPGACSLAGQLLVFRSAPPERLPQLLKDIGEAYYRWRPKTTSAANPFEDAVVASLEKTCDAVGILNKIELVHPGERFDAGRHTAGSRGVEITEVNGWIVLRDNGRVYTKASVTVR